MSDRMSSAILAPAALVAAITLAAAMLSHASAQTLVSPYGSPKAQPSPPSAISKQRSRPMKSCTEYGEGFVYVPGTDTCVKFGGYLRTDAVITRGR
jgi:hypothetical protein